MTGGRAVRLWVVDGNNVMGSRPDGWWRDRRGAARRLVAAVVPWQASTAEPVVVVFDGAPADEVVAAAAGEPGVEVAFADRAGPDAADDRIVALVGERYAEHPDLVVVTADRGLVDRLPPGVTVERPRTFLARLDPT